MGEMAQKISKVDHEELLKVLNMAFAEEWLAYYQYWVGAQVAVGPMRTSIVEEFMEHANEELKHAKWLSDRIIQLGGTPVLDPKDWESIAQCYQRTLCYESAETKSGCRTLCRCPLSGHLRNVLWQRLRHLSRVSQDFERRIGT